MDDDPVTFRVVMEDDGDHVAPCPTCGELIDDRDLTALLQHRGDHAASALSR